MSETLFIAVGWMLLLGGAAVAYWWGWRDPHKKARHCPNCWYDMGATAGLKCPECGHEAKKESKLFRAHRKWRWMIAGLALVVASYPLFKWPSFQEHGPIAFVPRIAALALLPEIASVLRERAPRGTPYGTTLAGRLSQIHPLNKVERFVLARAFRRMLFARSWSTTGMDGFFGTRLLSDQAGELVDPLVMLLGEGSSAAFAVDFASTLPRIRDARFRQLIAPIRSFFQTGSLSARVPDRLPERLRWWGASKEDCRLVAASILRTRKPKDSVDSLTAFMWKNDCVSHQDLCLLQTQLVSQNVQASLFAALCLADLGPAAAPVLDEVIATTTKPTSTLVNAAVMPLMAMGDSARGALPWLDGLSNHRNPLIASSALLAALSIRGEAEAAYVYWLACIEDDSEVNADAPPHQWMTPLILYARIPPQWKVEGLIRAIKRDQKLAGRTVGGVSGGIAIATDCLAKLGPAAIGAVPELVQLIQPGMPDFFVERVLDILTEFRGYAEFETATIEDAVSTWSKTAANTNAVDAALADLKAVRADDVQRRSSLNEGT